MPFPDREELTCYLKTLRDKIIAGFESFEPKKRFQRTLWNHHTGGGGEISLLRGDVFEKAAVNWSAVSGDRFPKISHNDSEGPFFATGVSLITHMHNPHAPTVHMNLRYIETQKNANEKKAWLGGGYDLTPMGLFYDEDREHFHRVAKESSGDLYDTFAQNAKEYFYIPHRKRERGVGGLFFDHYHTGNWNEDIALWQAVGDRLLDAILPIYSRRVNMPFTEEQKQLQLTFRAHYVEFNLLYDRGTRFGFLSGGNPDAILCSMPPLATW